MYDEARLGQAMFKDWVQPGGLAAVALVLPMLAIAVLLVPTMMIAPFSQSAQQFALDVLIMINTRPSSVRPDDGR
jgi:hypothetical protein